MKAAEMYGLLKYFNKLEHKLSASTELSAGDIQVVQLQTHASFLLKPRNANTNWRWVFCCNINTTINYRILLKFRSLYKCMVSTHDNFARLLSLSCKILHNEGVMCATSPFIIVFT